MLANQRQQPVVIHKAFEYPRHPFLDALRLPRVKPVLPIVEILPGAAGVMQALDSIHNLFENEASVALVPAGNRAAIQAVQSDSPLLGTEASLVLATSGSSGESKAVEISLSALAASAEAAAIYCAAPTTWLTALPVTGIGGLNTVIRSALSGTEPVIWDGVGGMAAFESATFNPFLAALRNSADKQKMSAAVSLVPTQIARLVDDPAAMQLLAALDFVLVGGAGLSSALREKLQSAGVNLIMTYGASETCGGILWNKTLLGDSQIEVDAQSQIWVTGSTIATGYRDGTVFAGRWNSGDIGTFANNELRITGRIDRLIKTNGNKVGLDHVTSLAHNVDGVSDAFAVGVTDAEAGQIACVAYVGTIAVDDFIRQLKSKLGNSLPLKALQLKSLPLLLNGKPDAAEITRICETSQL